MVLLLLRLCCAGAVEVVFSQLPGGGFELSNGLVRTRWLLPAGSSGSNDTVAAGQILSQTFDVSGVQGSAWMKLGDSSGVSVAIRNFPYNHSLSLRQKLEIPGLDHSLPAPSVIHAAPTRATKFEVIGNGTIAATVRYSLTLGVALSNLTESHRMF